MKKTIALMTLLLCCHILTAQIVHNYLLTPLAPNSPDYGYRVVYSKYEPAIYCSGSYFSPDSVCLIFKTDLSGNILWAKGIQSTPRQSFFQTRNVIELADTSIIVTLYMYFKSQILHFDKNGNLLSQRQLFGSTPNIYETYESDGYLFSHGVAAINNQSLGTFSKTDVAGNFIWAKSFPATITQPVLLQDKGWMLFSAKNNNQAPGANDMVIFRIDSTGNLLWQKQNSIAGYFSTVISGLETSSRELLAISLYAYYDGSYLSKFDSNGNILWTKKYLISGSLLTLLKIHHVDNNRFLITGQYENNLDQHPMAMLVDSSGNVLWNRVYETRHLIGLDGAGYHPDHGLTLFGNATYWNQPDAYIFLKTDSLLQSSCNDFNSQIVVGSVSHTDSICNYIPQPVAGLNWGPPTATITIINESFATDPFNCSPTSIETASAPASQLSIIPNPANNEFEILNAPEYAQLKMFQLNGKEVLGCEMPLNHKINTSALIPGCYLLQIASGNSLFHQKVFIVR